MYGKIIGIDFGNGTLKLCVVNRTLREEKLLQRTSFATPSSISDLDHSLASKLEEFAPGPASVSTAITDPPKTTRVLNFPFLDSRKINQVYRFELENLTTYSPDEKLSSYHLIKRDGYSEALVCMFDKSDVEEFLGSMEEDGIDPMFITFSPFAFSVLNGHLPSPRPLLLVDISSNEMNFILFDEIGLRRVRYSNSALEKFIQGLGKSDLQSFDFNGLDGIKVENNLFMPLIKEIVRTAHFFETELKREIESIVLTGDICVVPGIVETLKTGLNREIEKIFIPDLGEKDSPLYAKAYSLALYGGHSNQDYMNLRVDEFEFKGKNQELKKTFLVPILLFALLLVFTFYRNISDVMASKSNVESLQEQIQSEMKELFPNMSAVPDPVLFMNNEVSKVQDKLQLIEQVKGNSTPLDVLRDLSITFPAWLNIKVDELRFETGQKVKMWGRVGSYKDIAEIEKILTNSDRFQDVNRDQVNRSVNNTVKFVISMTVK